MVFSAAPLSDRGVSLLRQHLLRCKRRWWRFNKHEQEAPAAKSSSPDLASSSSSLPPFSSAANTDAAAVEGESTGNAASTAATSAATSVISPFRSVPSVATQVVPSASASLKTNDRSSVEGGVSPRVTTEKLGQLEAMVRAHPFAPTYGLANWSAAEAGWTVIEKAVPDRGAIGRRFIVVGPGGTPQHRTLPSALNDILRKAGAPVQPPPKRKRPNAAENAPLSPNGTLPHPHDTYLQQCSGAAGATSMTMNGDNFQKMPANSTSAVPMVDDDGAAAAAAMLAMAGLFTAAAGRQ